jgi:hypothetical protein
VRTLFQVLLDYDLPMLRAIAWHWDHELTAPKAREASEELSAAMLQPPAVMRVWQELPEPARAALGALLAAGGRMPTDLFFRRFGALAPVGPGRLEREERWRTPANVAERLWYGGLIARAFDTTRAGAEEFVFVPRDLRSLLPTAELPVADPPGAIAPPPAEPQPARANLVDDVTTLLAYLQVNPTAPGADPAKLAARLAPHLLDPDPARLALAWRLAQAAGLATPRNEHGHARLRPSGEHARPWMEAARGAQLRALARAWCDDHAWSDLRHVPGLEFEDTGWRDDPVRARTALLRHLAAVPAGTWWSLPAFVAAVKERDPDFARDEYESWYIRRNGGEPGDFLRGFEQWEQVEGALIAFVLQGPLHWLGLVDLAPGAFRLTARGTAFARDMPADEEVEDAVLAFRVRPDATVEVAPTARRYDRFQLARVSEWVRAGESYLYRLAPDSLERARAQGITLERLVEFLRRAAGAPLPAPVTDALRRWAAQGVEVTLHDALVLRVAEPALLEQLLNIPRVARYIVEPLGSRAALVKRADAERLAAIIREMGYLVRLE